MIKDLLRILIIVIVTIIISSLDINIKDSVINTFYTAESVLFSIIVSLTLTFNFKEITDERLIDNIRNQIDRLQIRYIIYFVISTIVIMFNDYKYITEFWVFKFNLNIFFTIIIVFFIIFFSIEFRNLQNIRYEIIDRINKKL